MIHQSHPSHYVAFDRTIQDIVYKLVPDLQTEECKRREKFFKKLKKKEKFTDNDYLDSSSSENINENENQGFLNLYFFIF